MKKILLIMFIGAASFALSQSTSEMKCDTLQPHYQKGVDALLWNIMPDNNYSTHPDFLATAWTYDGYPDSCRAVIKFNFSIPLNAIITNAELSLYYNPTSWNVGHSTMSGSNACWLRRITNHWIDSTVTWNTQPTYTTLNQVYLPASTCDTMDYPNINITPLMQDIGSDPANNFGFIFMLDNEAYYRSMLFASSNYTNPALHPKLVICYTISTAVQNEIMDENSFSISPNPSSGIFTFHSSSKNINTKICVYDLPGNCVLDASTSSATTSTEIDLRSVAKGIYFVKVQNEEGMFNQKIVVE